MAATGGSAHLPIRHSSWIDAFRGLAQLAAACRPSTGPTPDGHQRQQSTRAEPGRLAACVGYSPASAADTPGAFRPLSGRVSTIHPRQWSTHAGTVDTRKGRHARSQGGGRGRVDRSSTQLPTRAASASGRRSEVTEVAGRHKLRGSASRSRPDHIRAASRPYPTASRLLSRVSTIRGPQQSTRRGLGPLAARVSATRQRQQSTRAGVVGGRWRLFAWLGTVTALPRGRCRSA
jgi:hypothetical protein